MKLGIGLPTTLVPDLNRKLFLDWARAADQAGFHVFGTIDQPAYDSWDPLVALAAAAAVTERVRLATTVMQLPNRNEVLVAKQAAVIDRLSGGRLDLGLGIGAREPDYKAFNARFAGRGKKFERQIRKIRRTWRAAKKVTPDQGTTGPAPLQKPLPPIWIGGYADRAIERAVEIGDAYIIGTAGLERANALVPRARALAERAGKKTFPIGAMAYVAVSDDPAAGLESGARFINRYYGGTPPRPVEDIVHAGPVDSVAQLAKEYEQAGVDVLILFPVIPDVRQVTTIGEQILPSYRVPGATAR